MEDTKLSREERFEQDAQTHYKWALERLDQASGLDETHAVPERVFKWLERHMADMPYEDWDEIPDDDEDVRDWFDENWEAWQNIVEDKEPYRELSDDDETYERYAEGILSIEKSVVYEIQLSWGGPSDGFFVYVNSGNDITGIEYWFQDWFTPKRKFPISRNDYEDFFRQLIGLAY